MDQTPVNKAFYEQLYDEVRRSAGLTSAFKKATRDPSYANLFFAHPDDLFVRIKKESLNDLSIDFSMPILFFAEFSPQIDLTQAISILNMAVEDSDIKRDMITNIPEQRKPANKSGDLFGSFILFLILRYFRANPRLSQFLVSEKPLLFADVHKEVQSQDLNSDVFPEVKQINWKNLLVGKPKQLLSKNEEASASDAFLEETMLKGVEFFRNSLIHTLNTTHGFSIPSTNDARTVWLLLGSYLQQRRSYENYDKILLELYTTKMINNSVTVFVCTHCTDEAFLGSTRSRLSPKQLVFLCQKCGKQTLCVSAYELNDTLLRCIRSKDGMLSCAVAWCLQSKRIPFDPRACRSAFSASCHSARFRRSSATSRPISAAAPRAFWRLFRYPVCAAKSFWDEPRSARR